jgi:hypothetical protein
MCPYKLETMYNIKNALLWDDTPCGSWKNRRFVGMYRHIMRVKNQQTTDSVNANVLPGLLILFALMMEAIHYSETSVLTRATRCSVPEEFVRLVLSGTKFQCDTFFEVRHVCSYVDIIPRIPPPPTYTTSIYVFMYLSGLEWNQVHCYCGHLYCKAVDDRW